jgi:hypothetical protein
MTQFSRQSGEKKIWESETLRELQQELNAESGVTGLIGVETGIWTARDGRVYANARMNRRDCAARYAAIIRENDRIIGLLLGDAGKNPASFEAYAALTFAAALGEAADNFRILLSVLDPHSGIGGPDYGGAEALKRLARNAAQEITISIAVEAAIPGFTGDARTVKNSITSRIAQNLAAFFTARGFRISNSGPARYTVTAVFAIERYSEDERWKYAHYALEVSITGAGNITVFSYPMKQDVQGHTTEAGARERALAKVDESIKTGDFAAWFDKSLDALMGL